MPLKANRTTVKRHNRQLLLRSVYSGAADNRAALAQETGLAKPSVSDIVGELIAEGLLEETGRGESTDSGGKRPTLLRFVPNARQVIGVSVNGHGVFGVLSNLAGQVAAEHTIEYPEPNVHVVPLIEGVIDGLIAQSDSPLLCIGIGVPCAIDPHTGMLTHAVHREERNRWLLDHLAERYRLPVYMGNNSELAALAQYAFGQYAFGHSHEIGSEDKSLMTLVTLLLNSGVEVGVTHGTAHHHGGSIGSLVAGGLIDKTEAKRLDSLLGWQNIRRSAEEIRRKHRDSNLPADGLTYMHIRYAAHNGDPAALELLDLLSAQLATIAAWIVGLLNPDHISLAGDIVGLGERFLDQVVGKTAELIEPDLVEHITFSLAYSANLGANLSAIGAVAQAIQHELDII
jgi:N-acetylglucosamine repressor